MSPADVRWAGPRALLVELDSLEAVLAVHARLRENPAPGQVDVLAAAQTVLVVFDSRANARSAREVIAGLETQVAGAAAGSEAPVKIEVVYDGEDLTEVGKLTGLGNDGVIAAHTGQLWTAAFGGFAPGFAYLVGETDALNVPRRGTPRTAVPAGSVALAGNFSAVYPRRSPGGWQLIGHTAARMWDLEREPPALVRPGAKVQYVAVRELVEIISAGAEHAGEPHQGDQAHQSTQAPAGDRLEVLSPGPQALIQDLGRPGLGDLGVSPAGAADARSARQANRLVGNMPTDAVIENVLGGLAVRARGELTAALSGARTSAEIQGPEGSRAAPMYAPFPLHDGESLHLHVPEAGLRTYLAVRGGIDVAPVLGSRSTDLMSGIGPAPLAAGAVLPIGEVDIARAVGQPEPPALPGELASAAAGRPVVLRITSGPRHDWFTPESREALTQQVWTVTAESNRIGVRLDAGGQGSATAGKPLERARTGELPSEGVVAGSLQVPPSGLPVLFLADHPVTGGYPVIGAVIPEDLPAAAQLPPGTAVRFADVDPETLQPLAPTPST
ncbi:5-oxoprolinase/urea amidolyase family protein [Pseudarthrobacter sp. NamB4]|uniref:5-oxoprolinase subunit B/C family protein n=1 Tax=Pseudarthrobacter sp. NamB4 TaxID=2576837 RepID=UPI0010FD823C|nr:5-oxoprolinase/urea amidolyase family protein [Pseudarthrobacter sp. NamB4]TLM74965.1 5-oxoprolinase/urea amidolyase family protein [Pseudarthrobacter sp. NamB4]